jgi:hypothetical protein
LCDGIYIGDPESRVFTGSLASARVHGLDHEVLDAAAFWPLPAQRSASGISVRRRRWPYDRRDHPTTMSVHLAVGH